MELLVRIIFQFVNILFGMIGIRLDRSPARLLIWSVLIIGSLFLSKVVQDNGWAVWYMAGAWTFYYIGNTLILGTPLRSKLLQILGEERAYAVYEVTVGVMFVNQALSLGLIPIAFAHTFRMPPEAAIVVAALFFIIGFGSKMWSTWITGLDIYYYRDLFLRKPNHKFITWGPYRWFKNPMYSVGNLHAYAAAIFLGSLEGLAWAIACHVSIYLFYILVERPFVNRVYLRD